jgi:uracil-DNA glycosylase
VPKNSKTDKSPFIEESWFNALNEEFNKTYFISLKNFLQEEKNMYQIFPPGSQIFNAFQLTPLTAVKVVILGQDPYHGPGQAHGLCFSVPDGIRLPPSLVNIFKEIESDLKFKSPNSGNLENWAKQGVLLLNAALTVRNGQAGSHQGKGWEIFTDKVIETISVLRAGIVFLLWGRYAQAKQNLIDKNKHFILTTTHPSPLSVYRGFSGCKHFSQTNEILKQHGLDTIDWKLEN